jgi:membrane protease YdiL (CAAX protease family)
MTGAANVVPFLSLAVLLGYVALRSGSLLPGFLVHVTIDLAALAFFAGELPGGLRVLVDVGALVGVVLGLMLAGRRLGLRRRVPRVIDLRSTERAVTPVPS